MGTKNIRKDKNKSFFSATNNHQDSALFLFANKLLLNLLKKKKVPRINIIETYSCGKQYHTRV